MAITKRYRLVIDYEVDVSDWEPSGWHAAQDHPDFGTPGFDEWAENQRRLFDAFMTDPKRVEQMCRRSVLDAMETDAEDVRRQFLVPEEDSLFQETFAEMSPQDRAYWANICRKGLFSENADFVTYRFQPVIRNCTMQNLETEELVEAEPDRAEPLPLPVLRSNGSSVFHGIEAFGTWAQPEPEPHEPDWEKLGSLRKQVVLEESLPGNAKKFLQTFVLHRTAFADVTPDSRGTQISEDQIVQQANEWVASNSALSKQDLSCLKTTMRKFGLPKLFRQTFLQDMRRKNFQELCRAVSKENRFLH
jgi:hypothetical protein